MGLIELLIGLGVIGIAAPWAGIWGIKGYRLYLQRLREANAEGSAMESFKPVQQRRQEELSALVHRQEIAKNTAYAIQSEAALALTEATIEKALSSGDLGLAREGIQLALPGSPGAAYQVVPPQMQQFQGHAGQTLEGRLSAIPSVNPGGPTGWVERPGNTFQQSGTNFYLSLLRQQSNQHAWQNGMGNQPTEPAVDGELLPPEPAISVGDTTLVEHESDARRVHANGVTD